MLEKEEIAKVLREKYLEYEELMKVYESLSQKILDLTVLVENLKELKAGKGLFNVGGVFAQGSLENTDTFVVPVGANYFVEMPKEKVIESLSKQIEQLNEDRKSIKEKIEKLKEELTKELSKIQA